MSGGGGPRSDRTRGEGDAPRSPDDERPAVPADAMEEGAAREDADAREEDAREGADVREGEPTREGDDTREGAATREDADAREDDAPAPPPGFADHIRSGRGGVGYHRGGRATFTRENPSGKAPPGTNSDHDDAWVATLADERATQRRVVIGFALLLALLALVFALLE